MVTRRRIFERDGHKCVRCQIFVELNNCHIDHIKSGKLGTNEDKNLRTLCIRCHVLRADMRHRGMIYKAIRDGIIPLNWRDHLWEG